MPSKKKSSVDIIPLERVQRHILIIRSQRVILDSDLAFLYGVSTKRLNEQVSRNADRFPDDFMFRLTKNETESLRSQFATSNTRGGRRYTPFVFTEHGAIMAATILSSPQAVKASLFVVRAFVKLRELLSTHHQLSQKLNDLELKLQDHDGQILSIIEAIRELMNDPDDAEEQKPPVGFHTELQPPRKYARTRPRR
ncbi:MAG TPA: ORF6N domain-containing protein [Phycisphaerae bacterium]|nr:ORF6N domain-containing protein [Phycisphaerae bacterium]